MYVQCKFIIRVIFLDAGRGAGREKRMGITRWSSL